MVDLLKIFFIFTLILILLRKKLNIGLVMLTASFVLFVLYRMPLELIVKTSKAALLNSVTINLILALSFIRMFEMILREHDVLAEMMKTVKAIFKNRKIVTVSMPLLSSSFPQGHHVPAVSFQTS